MIIDYEKSQRYMIECPECNFVSEINEGTSWDGQRPVYDFKCQRCGMYMCSIYPNKNWMIVTRGTKAWEAK